MPKKYTPFLSVFLVLLSLACIFGSQSLGTLNSTLTPLSAAVAGTATANSADVGGAGDKLATAVSKATAQSADIYATETSRASLNDASKLATATVIAPAVAELPRYGIDPGQGHVAWVHPPATIELHGFQQSGYANNFSQITAKDFVMASDITWHTFNSLSGCGFMFRSNGNTNKPSQYVVMITRFATGYLAFTATVDGETSNMRTIYLRGTDKSFNWANDSTNRLAVVVRGKLIDAYTNGILVGEIDTSQPPPDVQPAPPSVEIPQGSTPDQVQQFQALIDQNTQNNDILQSQMGSARQNFAKNKPIFSEGILGFIGLSQSGDTTCTFSNAYLFIIER